MGTETAGSRVRERGWGRSGHQVLTRVQKAQPRSSPPPGRRSLCGPGGRPPRPLPELVVRSSPPPAHRPGSLALAGDPALDPQLLELLSPPKGEVAAHGPDHSRAAAGGERREEWSWHPGRIRVATVRSSPDEAKPQHPLPRQDLGPWGPTEEQLLFRAVY